jgi:lambda repressor-like predicted transcriptional regulator
MSKKVSPITDQERMRNIRAEMVRVGVTNAQIARSAQVVPNYVYFVISGKRKGYRIRRAIAEAVNQPVEQLWPDTPLEQRTAA